MSDTEGIVALEPAFTPGDLHPVVLCELSIALVERLLGSGALRAQELRCLDDVSACRVRSCVLRACCAPAKAAPASQESRDARRRR